MQQQLGVPQELVLEDGTCVLQVVGPRASPRRGSELKNPACSLITILHIIVQMRSGGKPSAAVAGSPDRSEGVAVRTVKAAAMFVGANSALLLTCLSDCLVVVWSTGSLRGGALNRSCDIPKPLRRLTFEPSPLIG